MSRRWLERYALCLRLAAKHNYQYRYDIVHDTWLYWQQKKGRDLFELDLENPAPYYSVVIRFGYFRWNYLTHKENVFGITTIDDNLASDYTTDESLIYKDLLQNVMNVLEEKKHRSDHPLLSSMAQILTLKLEGYGVKEIAQKLGVSAGRIDQQTNKIKTQIMSNNPFNGNRLKVSKTITENQWDKRTDKDDFEENDFNEYYRLMEHRESKEVWLIRLRSPDKNPYLHD